MNYTAEQMAKMIVLAEALMRSRATTPIKLAPVLTFAFASYADANLVEVALADACAAILPEPYQVPPHLKIMLNRLGSRNRPV